MQSPFRLDGRRALVTGGASRVGEQVTRVLTAAGASVTIAGTDGPRAEALAGALPGSSAAVLDVTGEAAVNHAVGRFDRLDIRQVNVTGTCLVTRAAMPLLLAARGSVVTRCMAVDYAGCPRVNCLCPEAEFVTGATPAIDGGCTA